jgi:hypothetical protein
VVNAPTAVLVCPDRYVAWVGDGSNVGLTDALGIWFGPADSGVAHRAPGLEPEWVPCLWKATELSAQVVDGATVV